jgi:hypothetical protein
MAAPVMAAPAAMLAHDDPTIERKGDDYWAYWPAYMVRMRFSSIHEKDAALRAELTVFLDVEGAPSPADWTTLDLASGQTRAIVANRLREHTPGPGGPPWREMLGQASYEIREIHRTGEQIQRIGGTRAIRQARYALYPILPEGQISILYGDGASLKSMIAMGVALSVQECRALLPGTTAGQFRDLSRQGPPLYLDYETNADEQHARMKRVAAGFGLGNYQEMLYRECHIPIPKDAPALRALVDEHDCKLVIVDSIGAALGGDPNDAATAIATMTALRSLRTTVLCIDHVTKTDDQGKPIGSAYKYNYARAAFHAKRVQENDSDVVNVALIHKKANNGRLVSPLGFAVTFSEEEDGPIKINRLDIRDNPELAQHATSGSRIEHALKHGALRAPELKTAVGEMKQGTFDQSLRRMVKSGRVVVLPDGRYGLGEAARR